MTATCRTEMCTAPAVWTVQIDRQTRWGVDVEYCSPHALESVASVEQVWGTDCIRVEMLRIVTRSCPPTGRS